MVTVRTFSELQEAICEEVQEMLVVDGLAAEVKSAFECSKNCNSNEILRQLVALYDVVDYRNTGRYEGLILSLKLKSPGRGPLQI